MREVTVADVDDALAEFVRLEATGWKGRQGSALSRRPDLHSFFQEYSRRAASRGELRLTRLTFGAVTAAVELSVEAHRRRWGLKVAYNEELAAFAPALQLVHASIRAAFDRGLDAYEFLGVAESWQQRWKPAQRDYQLLVIYPRSSYGIAGAIADLARFAAGKLRSIAAARPRTT
jgi:CelD/BcsL family acetyltransferase involved in cellulose biosynthesis